MNTFLRPFSFFEKIYLFIMCLPLFCKFPKKSKNPKKYNSPPKRILGVRTQFLGYRAVVELIRKEKACSF